MAKTGGPGGTLPPGSERHGGRLPQEWREVDKGMVIRGTTEDVLEDGTVDSTLSEGTLRCPNCSCGGTNLQYDRVTTHSREEDGVATVVVVDVPNTDTRLAIQAQAGNPSERRSGVVVEGWCELCGGRWVLTLAQHKGGTVVALVSR